MPSNSPEHPIPIQSIAKEANRQTHIRRLNTKTLLRSRSIATTDFDYFNREYLLPK